MKIIKLLQYRRLCVCELQAALGLAQSTVSKHLKILEEAGLIRFTKDGTWVNYELELDSDNVYARAMLKELETWLENEAEVIELKKRLPEIQRDIITKLNR